MDFLFQLLTGSSIAHHVVILSLVIALGLAIGSVKIFGVRLGVGGVLFAGLIFGHYHLTVEPGILDFVKEFGLILFVYTIGVQVGPGFFSSFKKNGLLLNILAAGIVLIGVLITFLIYQFGHVPLPAAVGLFSGATTNTPSLGAA